MSFSQSFHSVIWQTRIKNCSNISVLRQHHFSPLPSYLHRLPISTTAKNTHTSDKSDTCQKINTSSKHGTVWLSYISLFYFSIFDLSFTIDSPKFKALFYAKFLQFPRIVNILQHNEDLLKTHP
jgi:hypothetical protein